jgi:hypothetical protein
MLERLSDSNPILGVFNQHLQKQILAGGAYFIPDGARNIWLSFLDQLESLLSVVTVERKRPGNHGVQDNPSGPNIYLF